MATPNLADRYVRLLRLAARQPVKALVSWISEEGSRLPNSRIGLSRHRRGLGRLCQLARDAVPERRRAELEGHILSAEAMLAQAEAAATTSSVPSAEQRITLAPVWEREMNLIGTLDTGQPCPPDLTRLQELTGDWSDQHLLDWLVRGFAALEGSEGPAYLAFSPIRLYPVGRYIEQLGVAIGEARAWHLPVGDTIRDLVRGYLETGMPDPHRARHFDPDFWALHAALKSCDPAAAIPYRYLQWALPHARATDRDRLATAICAAVWETTRDPGTQAGFFEKMAQAFEEQDPAYHSAVLDVSLAVALLNEAHRRGLDDDEDRISVAAKCRYFLERAGDAGTAPLAELLQYRLLPAVVGDPPAWRSTFREVPPTPDELRQFLEREAHGEVYQPHDRLRQPEIDSVRTDRVKDLIAA